MKSAFLFTKPHDTFSPIYPSLAQLFLTLFTYVALDKNEILQDLFQANMAIIPIFICFQARIGVRFSLYSRSFTFHLYPSSLLLFTLLLTPFYIKHTVLPLSLLGFFVLEALVFMLLIAYLGIVILVL